MAPASTVPGMETGPSPSRRNAPGVPETPGLGNHRPETLPAQRPSRPGINTSPSPAAELRPPTTLPARVPGDRPGSGNRPAQATARRKQQLVEFREHQQRQRDHQQQQQRSHQQQLPEQPELVDQPAALGLHPWWNRPATHPWYADAGTTAGMAVTTAATTAAGTDTAPRVTSGMTTTMSPKRSAGDSSAGDSGRFASVPVTTTTTIPIRLLRSRPVTAPRSPTPSPSPSSPAKSRGPSPRRWRPWCKPRRARSSCRRKPSARGNYLAALESANAAIAESPGDGALHEYRALVLFALGKYSEAAGVLNPVLRAVPAGTGPRWRNSNDSQETYSRQLAASKPMRDRRRTRPTHVSCSATTTWCAATSNRRPSNSASPPACSRRTRFRSNSTISAPSPRTIRRKRKNPSPRPRRPRPSPPRSSRSRNSAASGSSTRETRRRHPHDGRGRQVHLGIFQGRQDRRVFRDYSMNDDGLLVLDSEEAQMVATVALPKDDTLSFVIAGGPPGDTDSNSAGSPDKPTFRPPRSSGRAPFTQIGPCPGHGHGP